MPKRNWRDTTHTSSNFAKTQDCDLLPEDVEDVKNLFKKTFEFELLDTDFLETWIGEDPSLTHHVNLDPELSSLKDALNATKDKLSSKDIEEWHKHTTKCNLAASIIPFIKNAGVELCTQAWVKFYEILNSFQLVPREDFLSVHLCEAPGAFVACLNHYLQSTKCRQTWDWRATTLNPYYEGNSLDETIPDDRLIRHTYSQWYFGRNGSGDITSRGYLKDLCDHMEIVKDDQEMRLLLVTADGSRDCQANPAEQEALVSRLHYCEMIAACLLLAKGGNFVLKVFTMFEPESVALMFLLNILFEKVHAKKPATSKSGNSEVYLVCLNYKRNVDKETLRKLLDITVYNETEKPVLLHFKQEIPQTFLTQHRQCCKLFSTWQTKTIESNVALYENNSDKAQRELKKKQDLALELFLQSTKFECRHRTKRLAEFKRDKSSFYIPKSNDLQPVSNWQQKHLKGTFILRQNLSSMPWERRIKHLEHHDIVFPNITLENKQAVDDEEIDDWCDVEKGRPFSVILNSRLCDPALMSEMNMMLKNCNVTQLRQNGNQEHATQIGKKLSEIIPLDSSVVVFWDVDPGKETKFPIYESFRQGLKCDSSSVHHVLSEKDLIHELEPAKHVKVIVNVTRLSRDLSDDQPFDSSYEELMIRKKMVHAVQVVLKHLSLGSQVILLTASTLTRLAAGVLYTLARSFQKTTAMKCQPNVWLHQAFVFDQYMGTCPALLKHLSEVSGQLHGETRSTDECLLEVVHFSCILNDRKFVQFLTSCNNYTTAGFINLMLDSAKSLNEAVQH